MIFDWFYTKKAPRGPENWKNICAIFHKAENESLQSPINLKEEEVTAEMDGNLLAFDYHATNFRSSFFNHTVHCGGGWWWSLRRLKVLLNGLYLKCLFSAPRTLKSF